MTSFVLPQQFQLSAWYAQPQTADQAGELLSQLSGLGPQSDPDYEEFIKLITHYWLQEPVARNFERWALNLTSEQNRALFIMIYGQLLMSCKKKPAMNYLNRGFLAAAHFFQPQDYFTVMKRNELLSYLTLSDAGVAPATLEELENEARVIRKLKKNKNHQYKNSQFDTLG